MKVWLRYDPTTEEVVIEDELGQETTNVVEVQRDGAFYLFGPIEVEELTQ